MAVQGRNHPRRAGRWWVAALTPIEPGRAKGEDAAITAEKPVSEAARIGSHPDDRRVDLLVAEAAEEGGVAEGEDAAVRGDQPVTQAARRHRHAHDRCVERLVAHAAVEAGIAEGEHAPVRRDLPVTVVGVGDTGDEAASDAGPGVAGPFGFV